MVRTSLGRGWLWLALCLWLATAAPSGAAADPAVEFREEPGRLRITVGGEPLATYVFRDESIPRPHFAHLHAPGGVPVTRNYPPVAGKDPTDHATLHPGLWLAFGDLGGADFWRNRARVEHEGFVTPANGGSGKGTFAVRNRYLSARGDTILCREVCRYTIIVRPAGSLLIAESEFTPEGTDLTFGDQEEMGFGVRVATPLTVKQGGRIVNAEGDRDERGVRGKASDWCDYSGTVAGRRVGVTLMPDPGNFRRSWFHARDYGLLVANPFGRKALAKGPESRVVVKRGEPFRLGFGVLLHASPGGDEPDLAASYREYLEQLKHLGPHPGAAEAKVGRVERAPSPSAVTGLGGFVGRRVRANREGALKPFDIETYIRMFEQPKHLDWKWIGEQAGKWLESAVWSSGQGSDRALDEKARAVLARLERAQEPSGYLGITDPALRTEEKPLRGRTPPPAAIGREVTVAPEAEPRFETIALPDGALGPGLAVPVELADGSRLRAPAWPFANAGAWYRAGEPKPDRGRAAFSYAVWLRGRRSMARASQGGGPGAEGPQALRVEWLLEQGVRP